MSDTALKTSYVEMPGFFDVGQDAVFGILTLPRTGGAKTGLIILTGGGTRLSVNRNRLSVRLTRELAALGYAGFRLDYHGVGDSTGSVDEFRLDRPFVADVRGAVESLRRAGVERVILAGSCFGARTALSAAAELDNVDGVILIATALRDYVMGENKSLNYARQWSFARYAQLAVRPSTLKSLFDARSRRTYAKYARSKFRVAKSRVPGLRRIGRSKPTATEEVAPTFEQPLRSVVARRIPVWFLYGTEDTFMDEYHAAAEGRLADVLGGDKDLVRLTVVPGKLHGFTSVASQEVVIAEILGWAAERRGSELETEPPATTTA
jgi:pimeloyl-ACP methyl ester carboxylesterase